MANSWREEMMIYTPNFLSLFSFTTLTECLPCRRCLKIFFGKKKPMWSRKSEKGEDVLNCLLCFSLLILLLAVFQVHRGLLFTYGVQAGSCVDVHGDGSFSYEVTSHQFRNVAEEAFLLSSSPPGESALWSNHGSWRVSCGTFCIEDSVVYSLRAGAPEPGPLGFIPSSSTFSCYTLSKLFTLSVPQFPHV